MAGQSKMATIPATPGRTVRRMAPLPQTRNRLELLAWQFMRYSGLVLVFLALSHFWMQHILIGTHNIQVTDTIRRWGIAGEQIDLNQVLWRAYYAVILGLAMLHGLNGLRQVASDYFRGTPYKLLMVAATALIAIVMLFGFLALATGAARIATN